ncbi:hypothetical protein Q1695_005824 [Nippostrongylus brasiliensis]|nr:hypothetical protein Q1695_005824 [Nippostrongylus brasiliensis]
MWLFASTRVLLRSPMCRMGCAASSSTRLKPSDLSSSKLPVRTAVSSVVESPSMFRQQKAQLSRCRQVGRRHIQNGIEYLEESVKSMGAVVISFAFRN